jgi:REP element-mobilizing transposase RayT
MGGIARTNGFTAVAVGGTGDHAHALLAIPSTMPLAKAVQLIKGGSSKWCNENLQHRFAWQEGYAALSVSPSQKDAVVHYIHNQKEHHAKHTFEDEFLELLKKSGIDFDANDVFG